MREPVDPFTRSTQCRTLANPLARYRANKDDLAAKINKDLGLPRMSVTPNGAKDYVWPVTAGEFGLANTYSVQGVRVSDVGTVQVNKYLARQRVYLLKQVCNYANPMRRWLAGGLVGSSSHYKDRAGTSHSMAAR